MTNQATSPRQRKKPRKAPQLAMARRAFRDAVATYRHGGNGTAALCPPNPYSLLKPGQRPPVSHPRRTI